MVDFDTALRFVSSALVLGLMLAGCIVAVVRRPGVPTLTMLVGGVVLLATHTVSCLSYLLTVNGHVIRGTLGDLVAGSQVGLFTGSVTIWIGLLMLALSLPRRKPDEED